MLQNYIPHLHINTSCALHYCAKWGEHDYLTANPKITWKMTQQPQSDLQISICTTSIIIIIICTTVLHFAFNKVITARHSSWVKLD